MFHHFCGGRHPAGQGALTAEQFDLLLDRCGPTLVSAEEWLERFRDDRLNGRMCVTLDDNLRCQFDIALPVLDARGLTALWFVYSSPLAGTLERLEVYRFYRSVAYDDVEQFYATFDEQLFKSRFGAQAQEALADFDPSQYLTKFAFYTDGDRTFRFLRDRVLGRAPYNELMDQMVHDWMSERDEDLLELLWMDGGTWADLTRSGHVVGLHSHTHPTDIASMSVDEQRQEYVLNRDAIAAATGKLPTMVAHPVGSYSSETLEILRDLGVTLGFATAGPVRFDPAMEVLRHDSADLMVDAGLRQR